MGYFRNDFGLAGSLVSWSTWSGGWFGQLAGLVKWSVWSVRWLSGELAASLLDRSGRLGRWLVGWLGGSAGTCIIRQISRGHLLSQGRDSWDTYDKRGIHRTPMIREISMRAPDR